MRHTCTYNPISWSTCDACRREAYAFSSHRDYEGDIDGPGGFLKLADSIAWEQEQAMRKAEKWPYGSGRRTVEE